MAMNYTKEVPVLEHYDVVVCGGGPAGIGAALAAAEHGCKTALIERFSFLGGMATAGYVNPMSEFAYNGRSSPAASPGGLPRRLSLWAAVSLRNPGAICPSIRRSISWPPGGCWTGQASPCTSTPT